MYLFKRACFGFLPFLSTPSQARSHSFCCCARGHRFGRKRGGESWGWYNSIWVAVACTLHGRPETHHLLVVSWVRMKKSTGKEARATWWNGCEHELCCGILFSFKQGSAPLSWCLDIYLLFGACCGSIRWSWCYHDAWLMKVPLLGLVGIVNSLV